jgi:hypothetical protein
MRAPIKLSNLHQFLFQRVATLAPGVKAAEQWVHAGDPLALEEERHTGAGGFAGSSAVKDDVAVAGDLLMPKLDLFRVQVLSAR